MKANKLLLLPLLCLSIPSRAQMMTNTIEYIDINNIKAGHQVHGDMWLNRTTGKSSCEFPKGSGKHIATLGSLWIGGYGPGGTLKVAAQTYGQTGADYWPGPIDTAVANSVMNPIPRINYTRKWAKIWKVDRTSIDLFRNLPTRTVANIPTSILQWPAKGNAYARGSYDTSRLTITRDLAPFIDVNNDGSYSALDGDYPKMKGDQMLWWIVNDATGPHSNSHGQPLWVEVQHSVYAYNRGSSMDNVIFYEFWVRNGGQASLNSCRFGLNTDFDLGYSSDDYVGMDSTHRMGFVYNSRSPDGNGEPYAYGTNIPSAGIVMLEQPGDNYPTLTPTGSFSTFFNGPGGNPTVDTEYNHMLRSRYGNGSGFLGSRYDYQGFYMCDSGFSKTEDRRFVMASNDITLLPGEAKNVALALVAAANSGACPTPNITTLLQTADSAVIVYYNPPAPTGVTRVASAKTLRIYPNPVNDILHIAPLNGTSGELLITDAMGRKMNAVINRNSAVIDISTVTFPTGIYTIIYKDAKGAYNNIFMKN